MNDTKDKDKKVIDSRVDELTIKLVIIDTSLTTTSFFCCIPL